MKWHLIRDHGQIVFGVMNWWKDGHNKVVAEKFPHFENFSCDSERPLITLDESELRLTSYNGVF